MGLRVFALIVVSVFVFGAGAAHAQITGPITCDTSSEGTMIYNDDQNVMQFCDGSDWIAMGSGTTQYSGPMVDGWPDAIVCDSSGTLFMYVQQAAISASLKYYHTAHINTGGSIVSQTLLFNDDGTFNSARDSGITETTDCEGKSIAQLYAAGQAFDFGGGGGGGSADNLGNHTATQALAMATFAITGLADPTNPQDAATKAYVDAEVSGAGDDLGAGGTTTGTLYTTNAGGVGRDAGDSIVFTDNTDMRFSVNASEAMRILANGNVGIGTVSPDALLTVAGSPEAAGGQINIRSSTTTETAQINLENSDGTLRAWYEIFEPNDAAQLVADTNNLILETRKTGGHIELKGGNVGIGTTSPPSKLSIGGGEAADEARLSFLASDDSARFTVETDLDAITTNDLLGFRSNSQDDILVLSGGGNVGIGEADPQASLHVDGTVRARAYLSPNGSSIIYAKPEIQYSFVNPLCPAGSRVIQVPQNFFGSTGNDICAADTASDGARTTCTAVKYVYTTVSGSAGSYAPNDSSCTTAHDVYWPWAWQGAPNSRPDEWKNGSFAVCCQ